ncbi:NACHT domain-containing NTPase [Saccharopolyspora gloriosae]|uniref:NACHT domain-containing protein n=1 Tax=Saccharopolyspora gloriosae TaxID=455344 RepID=UPI001FB5D9DF|nr:FtsK/SpoIIIE domain-containing protein [Saccharopolyspora gloriosae]
MQNRLARTVRTALLIGAGGAVTLVLVPTAISIGTGGHLPGFLQPLATFLWPLVIVFLLFAVALAGWERVTNTDKPITARRLNSPSNRERSVQSAERYARERIDGSLAEHVTRLLDVDEVPPTVARPADVIVQLGQGGKSRLPAHADLPKTLDDAHGSLLILGAPGSGKSTLLLELTRALALRATGDQKHPIPLIIDLGSWAMSGWRWDNRRPAPPGDFQKWLLREIERRYTIHPSLGRIWLEQGKIGLMLDGLDEVPPEYQERCVNEINNVRDAFLIRELVVCCRDEEHEALTTPLQLNSSVTINPLTRKQVVEFFTRLGPRVDGVRAALRTDPELWRLLDSPLMLSLMALAYQDRPPSEVDLTGTLEQRRREVFDAYLTAVPTRQAENLGYPPEKVLRTLRFLARVSASPLCNDLTARTRLPSLVAWARFLPSSTLVHVFGRGLPGVLAGSVTGTTLAMGMLLGPAAALVTAVLLVGYVAFLDHLSTLPWVRPAQKAGTIPQGWITAACGYVLGLVVSLALVGLTTPATNWLADQPLWVGVPAVIVAAFLTIMSAVEAWSKMPGNSAALGAAGAVLVGVSMFWIGPQELLTSMGIGAVLGIVAGLTTAARDEVWWQFGEDQYEAFDGQGSKLLRNSAPLVGAAGLLGVLPVLFSGTLLDERALDAGLGLLVAGLAAPAAWHADVFPFDTAKNAASEWLARAMALSELPVRRARLLRGLAEHSMLSRVEGGYRFTHLQLRDHLLGYERKAGKKPEPAASDEGASGASAEPAAVEDSSGTGEAGSGGGQEPPKPNSPTSASSGDAADSGSGEGKTESDPATPSAAKP